MPLFLPFLAILPLQTPFSSVTADGPFGSVTALTPGNTSVENMPATGTTQIKAWRGDDVLAGKKISFFMVAATSAANEANLKNLRDDIKKREGALTRDGGRTMTIERSGHKLRLTVRRNFSGQMEIFETAITPVLYFRSLLADKDATDRAKAILTGLGFRNGNENAVPMYDRGFPAGWTKDFAGARVKVPYPAQEESLSTDPKEDGIQTTVRFSGYESDENGSWAIVERLDQTKDSILEVAKRLLPRAADLFPKPRMSGADLVEWNGRMLLRQRGEYDVPGFEKEWVSLTARDEFWRLHTVILRKKKGTPWPKTPFPVDAPGTPVVEGAWKKPSGVYERTVDLGGDAKFTYSAFGPGELVAQNETYTLTNSKYESATLRYGKAAETAFAELDLQSRFETGLDERLRVKPLDYQWHREGKTWWLARRWLGKGEKGEDLVMRAEFVGTEQGGKPFVLSMVGIDNESFGRGMREAVVSCKGSDGALLFREHPWGKPGTEYILPFQRQRFVLEIASPLEAIALGDGHAILGGFFLKDEARVVLSVQMNHWGGVPHDQRVLEALFPGDGLRKGKKVKLRRDRQDVEAWRREYKRKDGTSIDVTTIDINSDARIHVLQSRGKPESWRKALGFD
ncbi:hypothetical protein EON82_09500 [bacterium]|nr:MAG: hypothetical protein EON82_09500 [bacterium]